MILKDVVTGQEFNPTLASKPMGRYRFIWLTYEEHRQLRQKKIYEFISDSETSNDYLIFVKTNKNCVTFRVASNLEVLQRINYNG